MTSALPYPRAGRALLARPTYGWVFAANFLPAIKSGDMPGKVNGMQSKMARAALGWSTTRLAKVAGVSRTTVFNFETGATKNEVMLERIGKAFSTSGVVFLNEDGFEGVMVPTGCAGDVLRAD